MSRRYLVIALLLGPAGRAAGQAREPVTWSLPVGQFTVCGTTTYTHTIVLRPRVVFDTTQGLDSSRVAEECRKL
jgi:hypothetical protein